MAVIQKDEQQEMNSMGYVRVFELGICLCNKSTYIKKAKTKKNDREKDLRKTIFLSCFACCHIYLNE